MTEEFFKLTPEMIKEIEEKVNRIIADVNNGMKERLVAAGCYSEWACVVACEITVNIEDQKVNVIDSIKTDDYEDDDNDTWFNYEEIEDND